MADEISANEIIPPYTIGGNEIGGLVQGNFNFASDPKLLKRFNIKLIVQAALEDSVKNKINKGLASISDPDKPLLLELNMRDEEGQEINSLLTKSLNYNGNKLDLLNLIEAVRQNGGNVLVNCAAGMSRSSVIILMYLMQKDSETNMSFLDAWRFLKYKRPIVFPDESFIRKLQQYERDTRGTSTVTDELIRLNPFIVAHTALVSHAAPSGSVAANKPGVCKVCGNQNDPTATKCSICGLSLNTKGGKRKALRKTLRNVKYFKKMKKYTAKRR